MVLNVRIVAFQDEVVQVVLDNLHFLLSLHFHWENAPEAQGVVSGVVLEDLHRLAKHRVLQDHPICGIIDFDHSSDDVVPSSQEVYGYVNVWKTLGWFHKPLGN